MATQMICRHYFVSGHVQGVGYRRFVQKQALAIGLKGEVRNLADGRVELIAAGSESQIRPFEAMIAKGPKLSLNEEIVGGSSGGLVSGIDRNEISQTSAVACVGNFFAQEFAIAPDGHTPWIFENS